MSPDPAAATEEKRGRSRTCTAAWRLQPWRSVLRVSLALGGGLLLAGCFYTGSLNERPRAEIEKVTPGPYHYPGDTVAFVARKSFDSEDAAGLTATWSAYTCSSDTSCAPIGDSMVMGLDDQYVVTIPSHDPIRIQLVVRDSHNAESRDIETLEVGNRPPVITVQVRQGGQSPGLSESYVVGLALEVAVKVDDPDKDPTTHSWALLRPRESTPENVTWRQLDDDGNVYQLIPDVAGVWRVDITATDDLPEGTEVHQEQILVDEDQPPCIGITSPALPGDGRFVLRREDGARSFAVLHVADDLDPWPRPASDSTDIGTARFAWAIAGPQTGGDLEPIAGATGADVVIDPASYAPGDLLSLRVDVSDRVERTATCTADDPTCSTADGCYQRLTWEVEIR